MSEERKAWAIEVPNFFGGRRSVLLGHGWFEWLKAPHASGCRIALFETRRQAREALRQRVRPTNPHGRVVRVKITIGIVGRG